MHTRALMAAVAMILAIAVLQAQPTGQVEHTGTSRRIEQLKRDVGSGAPGVTDRFWTALSREHGPIVEAVPGDPAKVLVTLVWRGDRDTKAVQAAGLDLQPIANTDVWFVTFTMASNHRLAYTFKAVKGSDPDASPVAAPDPLNPHRFQPPIASQRPATAIDPQSPYMNASILVLPEAPASPFVDPQPGVPAGTVEERTFDSEIYGGKRRIWIYTPANGAVPTGLLICLWGQNYLNEIPVPTILDNLLQQKRIPPLMAVFLDNDGDRFQDFQNTARFTASLTTELLPWLGTTVHAPTDPKQVIVTGYSAAGLASAYIAYKHPESVGNVLSQSGAYWRGFEGEGASDPEWISRQYAATPKRDTVFYLDVGGDETRETPGGISILDANMHLHEVLTGKGYTVRYDEVRGGEHEFVHWRSRFADGLLYLTTRWRAPATGE
jgi:enterochelin esterase family protein